MPIHTPFLLLADIEGFFGIVFFLIAFVGWVINLVSQNQEKGKGGQRPPARQGQPGRSKTNVRSEIDQFLNQSKRSSNRSNQDDLDEVEVISVPSQRRPPQQRRPPKRRRSREEVLAAQAGSRAPQVDERLPRPKSPSKPGEAISSRHLETLASQRTEQPHLTSRVTEQVQEHLSHGVDLQVSSQLDTFAAALSSGRRGMASTTTERKSQGTLIGQLLRSKSGIRNAIILNEVLSPPKSLRK